MDLEIENHIFERNLFVKNAASNLLDIADKFYEELTKGNSMSDETARYLIDLATTELLKLKESYPKESDYEN